MQIANVISDTDRDGWTDRWMDGQTGVTLYALSTILRMAGA